MLTVCFRLTRTEVMVGRKMQYTYHGGLFAGGLEFWLLGLGVVLGGTLAFVRSIYEQ